MKLAFFFFFFACVASSMAAPPNDVQILRYDNENNGLDSYNFAFETSDGTSRAEQGQLKNAGTDNEALAVSGSFSYVGPDGVQYTVNYIADENGFQATGDHLPKAP